MIWYHKRKTSSPELNGCTPSLKLVWQISIFPKVQCNIRCDYETKYSKIDISSSHQRCYSTILICSLIFSFWLLPLYRASVHNHRLNISLDDVVAKPVRQSRLTVSVSSAYVLDIRICRPNIEFRETDFECDVVGYRYFSPVRLVLLK